MAKLSKNSERKSKKQEHPLAKMQRELMKDLADSGLTVGVMEPPTDTTRYEVTFVPRATTKPS